MADDLSIDDMVELMGDAPEAEPVDADTIEEAEDRAEDENGDPVDGDEGEEEPAAEDDDADEDGEDDEDGEEDGDEDQDDEEDDEEGDDEAPAIPDDAKVKVKVNGEETEVTFAELRDGYQRRADYTRKTEEVAQGRKEIEAARTNMTRQAQAYAQAYLDTAENIASFAPTEADIQRAGRYDPSEAARLTQQRKTILSEASEAWDRAKALYDEQDKTTSEQMAETAKVLDQFVPEWADLDLRKKEIPAVADFLQQEGMPAEVVGSTTSPVAWKIARKAWLYDQLQKTSEAKVERKPKPATSKRQGAPGRKAPAAKRGKRAERSFAKTNSKEALVEIMNNMT